jgi:hypothetical protein
MSIFLLKTRSKTVLDNDITNQKTCICAQIQFFAYFYLSCFVAMFEAFWFLTILISAVAEFSCNIIVTEVLCAMISHNTQILDFQYCLIVV